MIKEFLPSSSGSKSDRYAQGTTILGNFFYLAFYPLPVLRLAATGGSAFSPVCDGGGRFGGFF